MAFYTLDRITARDLDFIRDNQRKHGSPSCNRIGNCMLCVVERKWHQLSSVEYRTKNALTYWQNFSLTVVFNSVMLMNEISIFRK